MQTAASGRLAYTLKDKKDILEGEIGLRVLSLSILTQSL